VKREPGKTIQTQWGGEENPNKPENTKEILKEKLEDILAY